MESWSAGGAGCGTTDPSSSDFDVKGGHVTQDGTPRRGTKKHKNCDSPLNGRVEQRRREGEGDLEPRNTRNTRKRLLNRLFCLFFRIHS